MTFGIRAEVGLLTRNIVYRGMGDPDYEVVIEACAEDADLGN